MPLLDDGQILLVHRDHQLHELVRIPSSVTKVVIKNCEVMGYELPPHVRILELRGSLLHKVPHLNEGLEEIHMREVETSLEGALVHWVFPASLRLATFMDCFVDILDLRAVTAPTITLFGTSYEGIRLPELLDELVIDGSKNEDRRVMVTFSEVAESNSIGLPRRLRSLILRDIAGVRNGETLEINGLEHLSLKRVDEEVDYVNLFVSLQTMYMERVQVYDFSSLELPHLRELTLLECGSDFLFSVDAPVLETLAIINGTYILNRVIPDQREVSPLGSTLKNLTLSRAPLLLVDEWQQLEFLSMTNYGTEAVPALPFMPHLKELVVDKPLITNGYEVRDLSEYKQAWGQSTRKKGVPRHAATVTVTSVDPNVH